MITATISSAALASPPQRQQQNTRHGSPSQQLWCREGQGPRNKRPGRSPPQRSRTQPQQPSQKTNQILPGTASSSRSPQSPGQPQPTWSKERETQDQPFVVLSLSGETRNFDRDIVLELLNSSLKTCSKDHIGKANRLFNIPEWPLPVQKWVEWMVLVSVKIINRGFHNAY